MDGVHVTRLPGNPDPCSGGIRNSGETAVKCTTVEQPAATAPAGPPLVQIIRLPSIPPWRIPRRLDSDDSVRG